MRVLQHQLASHVAIEKDHTCFDLAFREVLWPWLEMTAGPSTSLTPVLPFFRKH